MKTQQQVETRRIVREAIVKGLAAFNALVADGSLPNAMPYDAAILIALEIENSGIRMSRTASAACIITCLR